MNEESTQQLIERAERLFSLLENGQIDQIKDIQANIVQNLSSNVQIKTLSPACNTITVKNILTVTDSSIVTCTGSAVGTCPGTIPGSCPVAVSPVDYVNMITTITAAAAQTAVPVTFQYVLNGIPTSTTVTADLAAGNNIVYAFGTNQQYPANTTLTLFGVSVPT